MRASDRDGLVLQRLDGRVGSRDQSYTSAHILTCPQAESSADQIHRLQDQLLGGVQLGQQEVSGLSTAWFLN